MKFKQFSCILGLAIGIIASNTPKANALDFTFSFSNNGYGNVNGTVTGIIKGLQDNTSNQQASEVGLTSYPSALGSNSNPSGNLVYSSSGNGWNRSFRSNNFTVTNGTITNGIFFISGANGTNFRSELYLNDFGNINYLSLGNGSGAGAGNCGASCVANNQGFSGVTFTPVSATVPFEFSPSQGIAIGAPLFIGLRMLKRKRALRKTLPIQEVAVEQVS